MVKSRIGFTFDLVTGELAPGRHIERGSGCDMA